MMARDCYDDCIAFLDEQLGRLARRARAPGAPRQHGGDHHLGPWRGVRRSWHLRPLLQRLPRRDRRPAGDPLARRAGGPGGGQPGQPARPAGDRGRPAGPLGRFTVPGPLAGGLLGRAIRAPLRRADQPGLLGADRPEGIRSSPRARGFRTGSPDVHRVLGLPLHPERRGGRAALQYHRRIRSSSSMSSSPPTRRDGWYRSEGSSSRC